MQNLNFNDNFTTMTTTKFLKYLFSTTVILLLTAFAITSCSDPSTGTDEEVTESVALSVTLEESEFSDVSGSGKIYYTASVGTEWSAEVVEGADFASFSLSKDISSISGVANSAVRNILYFYLDQNDLTEDRQATISFAFSGEEEVRLTLNQRSTTSSNNPYKSDDSPRWNEIPAKVEDDSYIYVSHSATLNGSEVRNYSLCFDKENHAAAWVAYPYHAVYDGNVGRVEDWTYDPKIEEQYQPNLSKSYTGSYDRGHQMASADRQATSELNRQSFYYSNMTPQLNTLNQQKWADIESVVRDQVCSDTLFVVTGADFTTTVGSTTDRDGMVCPLPGAYFKVLLRTRLGNTGKAVNSCSASELQAIGFWFEHKKYTEIPDPISVKEIEERTGFIFFPNVPEEVKSTFRSTDWSL
ncbi:MAG: DNA/RNA non-specific endonuclease [Rikenellaceae bacterium]